MKCAEKLDFFPLLLASWDAALNGAQADKELCDPNASKPWDHNFLLEIVCDPCAPNDPKQKKVAFKIQSRY